MVACGAPGSTQCPQRTVSAPGCTLLRGMRYEAVDGPKPPRWPCALDGRCSYYSDALVIDTSHVCLLVRAASLLAADDPPLAERFRELLVSHMCDGHHRLMSSQALLSDEREMNLASPDSAPRRYGDLPLALNVIESIDGGSGEGLPSGPPGERDRTLVVAAVAVSGAEEQTVMVVTDDEELADWVAKIAAGMGDVDVAILAASSVDLLGRMHACGTIDLQVVTAVGDAEGAHLNGRMIGFHRRRRPRC